MSENVEHCDIRQQIIINSLITGIVRRRILRLTIGWLTPYAFAACFEVDDLFGANQFRDDSASTEVSAIGTSTVLLLGRVDSGRADSQGSQCDANHHHGKRSFREEGGVYE